MNGFLRPLLRADFRGYIRPSWSSNDRNAAGTSSTWAKGAPNWLALTHARRRCRALRWLPSLFWLEIWSPEPQAHPSQLYFPQGLRVTAGGFTARACCLAWAPLPATPHAMLRTSQGPKPGRGAELVLRAGLGYRAGPVRWAQWPSAPRLPQDRSPNSPLPRFGAWERLVSQ